MPGGRPVRTDRRALRRGAARARCGGAWGAPTLLRVLGEAGHRQDPAAQQRSRQRALSPALPGARGPGHRAGAGGAAACRLLDAIEPPPLVPPALRADLAPDRLALLGGVIPGLRAGPSGEDPGGERWRLYRALAELLPLIAAGRPLLLLIDDVHWADPASQELLAHLIRRPPGDSLLIAPRGLDPGPGGRRLRVAEERASSAIALVECELAPLTARRRRAPSHRDRRRSGQAGPGLRRPPAATRCCWESWRAAAAHRARFPVGSLPRSRRSSPGSPAGGR